MNLRHQTEQTEQASNAKSREAMKQGQAWYLEPESTQPLPVTTETPVSQTKPQPAPSSSLFEPSAAERILARAGALQEVHGQMLSQEQIEAVAHEIGIQPEFVRLAIEQERNCALPVLVPVPHETIKREVAIRGRIAAAVIAYSIVTLPLCALSTKMVAQNGQFFELGVLIYLIIFFALPAFLALGLGVMASRRGLGALSGAALALAVSMGAVCGEFWAGDPFRFSIPDISLFAFLIGIAALLGATGAQARRMVSRRQASNRSRRAILRKPEQGA